MSARRAAQTGAAAGLALCLGVLGVASFSCVSDGPIGPFPGGALRGEALPCLETGWERFASETESELEVRPERPRSIRTWNVVQGGRLYLPADFLTPIKRWPQQVQEDDRVKLRIGGALYRCRAVRVGDAARIEALRAAVAVKYDVSPDGRAARVPVWWFLIAPRSSP